VEEKPDNVADNPGLLPYGSNVGAPAIKVENINSWKLTNVHKVNKIYQDKFKELQDEYNEMMEEFFWNDLIYSSEFNFEPVVGETYHLYKKNDGKFFLSLIEPSQWKLKCLGSFKFNNENKWIKI
jgi:hypothetical protein